MSTENVALVTGAGGFIGSHLVERLLVEGCRVKAFVRYTSRPGAGFLADAIHNNHEGLDIIRGDLRDFDAVFEASRGVHTIFHLGALIGIPYSYVHPRETVDVNVMGTLNVLNAARLNGVKRVVHTSTSEVYGTARYVPIDEKHPLQGQSPYSASKIGADKIAESFFDSYNLPVVVLRPFNTFGPRQSARAVIPVVITQALRGEEISLGNLTPRRDFTFVSDTVEGFLKAAHSDLAVGKTVNLGTGTEISMGELVEKIGRIMGKNLAIHQDAIRQRPPASEVDRLLSDNRLAGEVLGWKPQINLDEGLSRTIDWITENLHHFQVGRYEI